MNASWILTVSLTLAFSVVARAQEPQKHCEWKSQHKPDPITGSSGSSSEDDYWFWHMSDVDSDPKSKKNQFVFAIRNQHARNYLPAEWQRGMAGGIQISFRRIAPEGCAGNDFETRLKFVEDSNGVIFYGPVAQTKKDAPLYVRVIPDKVGLEGEDRTHPNLKSRVSADILDDRGERKRLDIEFSTERRENDFSYSVVNRSDFDCHFAMKDFAKVWSDIAKDTTLEYRSRWAESKEQFVAKGDKETRHHIIRVADGVATQEQILTVEVTTPDGSQIAQGSVTMYLPFKRD